MIYYKYKSDTKYTEEIFTSGKVFLSNANGLNDPFECSLQEIGKEWILDQIKQMKSAAISGFVMAAIKGKKDGMFFGLNSIEIEDSLAPLKTLETLEEKFEYYYYTMNKINGNPPSNPDKLFSQIDAQLLDVGIFSLSSNHDHPLMWAHYGGDHFGLNIGFSKQPESKLNNKNHFMPVIYSDELPEMSKDGFKTQMTFSSDENGRLYSSSYKISFEDETFQKVISTKPSCWGYEKEWRYVEPFKGLYDWPGQIEEVTFGLRCPDNRINHYINLIEENILNEVRLYRIVKSPGTNKLKRIEHDKTVSQPDLQKISLKVKTPKKQFSTEEFKDKLERLLQQERYGEVIFQTEENLKTHPESPTLLHFKGVAHGLSNQPVKALECFSKYCELYPDIGQAWYQKSCSLIELGRHEEALQDLVKAYKLDKTDPSIPYNLAIEIIMVNNDLEEALKYLKIADRLGHRKSIFLINEIEKDKTTHNK